MTSTRNRRVAALAGIAVALVAAGGAYAASKLHHGAAAAAPPFGRGGLAGAPAGGPPGYGFRGGFDGNGRGPGEVFQSVTGYLGISTGDLLTQLRAGKTLAEIADATSGKSASGLVDSLVAAERKEHPDASVSEIRARVSALVDGTGFGFPRFGFRGPGGPPGQPAEPPQQGSSPNGVHI